MSSAPDLQRPKLPPRDEAASRVTGLYERHGRMVYGLCCTMLRDFVEAEDATQEAFVSAYRAVLRGVDVRDDAAWIAAIARNECRARIAAAMRTPVAVAEAEIGQVATRHDEVERRAQAREIREALEGLPPRQREAVALRYVYGLPYGEVAAALGLSRPAVEALLFRARRAMRVRLRSLVTNVLVIPVELRDRLADQIPGFASSGGGGAASVAGAGLVAKVAAAPIAAKLAVAAAAVTTVGAVGVAEVERSTPVSKPSATATAPAPNSAIAVERALGRRSASDGAVVERSSHVQHARAQHARHGRDRDDASSSHERSGTSEVAIPSTDSSSGESSGSDVSIEIADSGPGTSDGGTTSATGTSGPGSSGPSGSSVPSEPSGSSSGPGGGATATTISGGGESGPSGSSGSDGGTSGRDGASVSSDDGSSGSSGSSGSGSDSGSGSSGSGGKG
jgi:RNA polymerase sigma factor (sigma-70 family)